MGCTPFSKSCSVYSEYSGAIAPNPIPANFKILELLQISKYLIAKIEYPDCTNFEGVKICVFCNITIDHIKTYKSIDPHFSDSSLSPIARFKPDEKGYEMAVDFVNHLSKTLDK